MDTRVAQAIDADWPLGHQATSDRRVLVADALEVANTLDLLARAQSGDRASAEALFARCLPALRRWARGRLPQYARDLADTQDLVHDALMNSLHRLHAFDARYPGALQAYLRQAVHNRICDEIRRVRRRPASTELDDRCADGVASPLEVAIGREGIERYEAALQRLRTVDREAIVARIELQQSYEEVAVALGKATPDAARVAVKRALARLVRDESMIADPLRIDALLESVRRGSDVEWDAAEAPPTISAADRAQPASRRPDRPSPRTLAGQGPPMATSASAALHTGRSTASAGRAGATCFPSKPIARARSGACNRARDPWLDREVALKLLGRTSRGRVVSCVRRARWRGCGTRTWSRCTARTCTTAAPASGWSWFVAARWRQSSSPTVRSARPRLSSLARSSVAP